MSSVQSENIPESRFRAWLHSWRVRLASQRFFTAYFFLSAVIIVAAFLVYAQVFVVQPMRQEANRMGQLYAFMHSVATLDKIEVKGFYVDVIFDTISNPNFPVVITDEQGVPRHWKAVAVADTAARTPENLGKLMEIARELDLENESLPFEFPGTEWGPDNQPILGIPEIWQLHWGESKLEKRLIWLPFVALGVTVLFTGIGYLGFRSIKNNEQRSIWVGMARETAHQLGTPLSSIYGWLELLKAEADDIGDSKLSKRLKNTLVEMDRDTSRLNKIASRFSLIGSTPELHLDNLRDVVAETAGYLRARLPKDVQIEEEMDDSPVIPLNRELLGWAFENLLKNAADAMEGQGGRIEISFRIDDEAQRVVVEVHDTGKGIPVHMFKQVFLPGISTKKRGWGLGLAFVKRIVEEYHNGRIFIKESAPDRGTTFVVSLPLAPDSGQVG
ncbi:MAG: HAMP domain-containing sensor histidine kinase [Candidatus Latescibacteria bacterium]|nr:HAMP domain-containing sensor histidine kinase [Candidatus Latescibacterota bacterium]